MSSLDLLVTDVVMPKMNRCDLAAAVCQIHPESRVLFVSGFTQDVILDGAIAKEGVRFFLDPFTATPLVTKIPSVFDDNATAV